MEFCVLVDLTDTVLAHVVWIPVLVLFLLFNHFHKSLIHSSRFIYETMLSFHIADFLDFDMCSIFDMAAQQHVIAFEILVSQAFRRINFQDLEYVITKILATYALE